MDIFVVVTMKLWELEELVMCKCYYIYPAMQSSIVQAKINNTFICKASSTNQWWKESASFFLIIIISQL